MKLKSLNLFVFKMLKFIVCIFIIINTQIAYSTENNFELVIPFKFNNEQIPYINIVINNKPYVFLVDLGIDMGISIKKEILKMLPEIKYTGNEKKFSDLSGDKFVVQQYVIPKIRINGYIYKDVSGYEYVEWGVNMESDVDVSSENKKIDGVIGRNILKNHDLIIDYKSKQFVVIFNQKSKYTQSFNDNNKIPFLIDDDGIKIKLLVNKLKSTFILDTGASISLISNKYVKVNGGLVVPCNKVFDFDMDCNVFQAKSLSTDSKKLLPINFMIYELQGLTSDGILGYDFFISNKIMLHFNEKIIRLE